MSFGFEGVEQYVGSATAKMGIRIKPNKDSSASAPAIEWAYASGNWLEVCVIPPDAGFKLRDICLLKTVLQFFMLSFMLLDKEDFPFTKDGDALLSNAWSDTVSSIYFSWIDEDEGVEYSCEKTTEDTPWTLESKVDGCESAKIREYKTFLEFKEDLELNFPVGETLY